MNITGISTRQLDTGALYARIEFNRADGKPWMVELTQPRYVPIIGRDGYRNLDELLGRAFRIAHEVYLGQRSDTIDYTGEPL